MVRFVRTQSGLIVHRHDCPKLGISSNAAPWNWAEERSLDEIRAAIAMVGSRACRACKPTEGAPGE